MTSRVELLSQTGWRRSHRILLNAHWLSQGKKLRDLNDAVCRGAGILRCRSDPSRKKSRCQQNRARLPRFARKECSKSVGPGCPIACPERSRRVSLLLRDMGSASHKRFLFLPHKPHTPGAGKIYTSRMSGNGISAMHLFASDVRYSGWANRQLLDACAALPTEELERDLRVSHKSLLATLQHICDGETVWLDCLCTTAAGGNWQLPPGPAPKLSFVELQQTWPQLWNGYQQWLEGLPEAGTELQAEVFVQIPDGRVPRFARWQILRHVLDHSQFHRGQAIGMIRSLGHTPPAINRGDYWLAGGE